MNLLSPQATYDTCVATPYKNGFRDTLPCDRGHTRVVSCEGKIEYITCGAGTGSGHASRRILRVQSGRWRPLQKQKARLAPLHRILWGCLSWLTLLRV